MYNYVLYVKYLRQLCKYVSQNQPQRNKKKVDERFWARAREN